MTFALELCDVSKRFGSVEALARASLRVRPGTVHALLGENGAGKTTLMRIAYGAMRPDAGSVFLDGIAADLRSSADAIARGLGMVHQHFALVPAMTVAENVALGMRGRYDAGAAAARVRALGQATGLVLDPGARVETLPVGAQQRVEIVKALARDARVLILDEPTSVLPPGEAEELLRWVRRFRDQGRCVVLITHKLREALSVADDMTVLRRGATILTGPADSLDEPALVAALLGGDEREGPTSSESSATLPPAISPAAILPRGPLPAGNPVATLRHVSITDARGRRALHDASLDVHQGEIVGLAAVEGSGQHELLRLLAGRLTPTAGDVTLPESIAFIPEDRHRDALVLGMTLLENVALRGLGARRGRMPWGELRDSTESLLARFHVRATGPGALARELSGGNQQKLVLGRELSSHPAMVVAENPTRGLDIRAIASVQAQLRAARDAGSAVVLHSSDLDEVLALADRVLVLHDGRVQVVDTPTRERVGRAMLGATIGISSGAAPADVPTAG